MSKFAKKITVIASILFAIGLSFCAGLYMNSEQVIADDKLFNLTNRNSEISAKLDFAVFWKVWDIISKNHVSSGTASSTPDQEKIYWAIKGLVASLKDPYSEFMPPEKRKEFDQELSGSLDGIGIEVGVRNGVLTVVTPIKNSPADKAGIRAEDVIFEINGVESSTLSVSEAVSKIRGKKGTKVELTLKRKGTDKDIKVSIIRDTIMVPTLEAKVLKDGVFMIRLNEFNGLSAGLFEKAMNEFYSSGYKKLILDLRNNPGGYLEASVSMASHFIPAGKVIVKEDYGTKKEAVYHRSKGFNAFPKNKKMVVLINGGSASASEILAGALSDYGVATLVGEKSFGKGSVQELISLPGDSSLKLTVATWWTPNNKSINKEGLVPSFVVKPTDDDIKKGKDVQLNKAIEILKK